MSPAWVAFIAGAFVWGPVGFFVAAVCIAGARADERSERLVEAADPHIIPIHTALEGTARGIGDRRPSTFD